MGIYASGAKSYAICDRCGFKYQFLSLREEWTGHKVCSDCWEPKHPQLEPRSAVDATLLYKARPGENKREDASPRIFRGVTIFSSLGIQVEVSKVLSTGVASTSALGAEVPTAFAIPSGVASTGAVGNISSGIILAGVAITSAIGAESISAGVNLSVTGVAITSAVGNEIPVSVVLETGVAITSAVGTIEILRDVWGDGTWGDGTWGS